MNYYVLKEIIYNRGLDKKKEEEEKETSNKKRDRNKYTFLYVEKG